MGGPRKGARVSVLDLPKEAQKHIKTLTPRHKIFVLAYLACWNFGKAALEAGYGTANPSAWGQNLYRREDIRKVIELASSGIMSGNEILERQSDIARADIYEFISFDSQPVQKRKLVSIQTLLNNTQSLIKTVGAEADALEQKAQTSVSAMQMRDSKLSALNKLMLLESQYLEQLAFDPDAETIVLYWENRNVPRLDLEKAKINGKTHIAKEIEEGKFGFKIKLHDAMAAQERLGDNQAIWDNDEVAIPSEGININIGQMTEYTAEEIEEIKRGMSDDDS